MSCTSSEAARTVMQFRIGGRRSRRYGKRNLIDEPTRSARRHCGKDENENQPKGFPCAARGNGHTKEPADNSEALLQVEEAVSGTPERTPRGVELAATSS